MTPAIPPDARKVVLAAVVPCKGDDLAPFVPKCSVPAGSEWEAYAASAQCATCIGNYERWVVTDIEVEPDDAVSGDTTVRVWLEVQL